MLCPQFCGTDILWDNEQKCYVNKRDKKRHICPIAERAKEFIGKYNMIQIKTIRPHIDNIEKSLNDSLHEITELNKTIKYVESERPENNVEMAKRFDERKAAGNKRNYQPPR